MKRYDIKNVEKGKITVNQYLAYKVSSMKPYRFKKASGIRVVFMSKNYLFLTPKVPFWIFRFLGKMIKKIPSKEGYVDFKETEVKSLIPLLKTLGKNNMVIGVDSPKENIRFEIWGV